MQVDSSQNKARISVIIANFNYGAFIGPCIDSVLAENYPALQILVVDDGSTDTSREVIESFGSSVEAIFKENGRQISCWNVAMQRTGASDIIVFLDSDDMLEPGVLDAYAVAFSDPEVVRCQGYMRVVDSDGKSTGTSFPTTKPDDVDCQNRMLTMGPGSYITVPTSGNAWRASYLRKLFPLPDILEKGGDVMLFGTAPFFGKTVTLPGFTAQYRIHGTGMTESKKRFNATSANHAVEVYDRLCDWIQEVLRREGRPIRADGWHGQDWRIATLRHLAYRSHMRKDTEGFSAHIGSVRNVKSPLKKAMLVGLISVVRLAPAPVAWALARRAIAIQFLAG